MPRTVCKVFTSYSLTDIDVCRKLLRLLQVQTALSTRYDFLFWNERWPVDPKDLKTDVANAVSACDLGLLLLSPGYASSKFVLENELPGFTGPDAKPAVAVEVKEVGISCDQLQGLADLEVFKDGKRVFGDCTGRQQKLFVQKLFVQKLHNHLEAFLKDRGI